MSVNDLIRKAGEPVELTKEQILEMARIYKRPNGIFRFIHYVDINTKDGPKNFGKIIKPFQYDMIKLFHDNEKSILLASRQMSKTTTAAFYILYESCFPRVKGDYLIVAHRLDHAQEVLRRIKEMYYSLPKWLKPGVEVFNKTSITFDNGVRVIAEPTTENAGRGKSLKIVYCVTGDTKIKIRNKKTGEIKEVSIQELYENPEYK